MLRIVAFVGLSLLLEACELAEAPFIYIDPRISNDKKKGDLFTLGLVRVCYHDPDFDQAQALAVDACKEYGLSAYERRREFNQCKLTAPNRVTFRCYDPNMRFSNGAWVNPLSKQEVKRWRTEQTAITGKPLNEIYAGPIREIPDLDENLGREDEEVPMKLGN